MILFSVVIPVFNRGGLIQKTLESVLGQDQGSFEIIVVDDGSSDRTLEVLAGYEDHIKVLCQDNQGPGIARNLGIRHAQGEYIVFLDSDDLWFPWTLSVLEQAIKGYQFPAFIAGSAFSFKQDSELLSIQPKPLKAQCFSDYLAAAREDLPFLTSAVAVKRTVIQEVGGFTTQRINAEDNDLWLKLGTAKNFVYVQQPVLVGYRQHENSEIADLEKTHKGALHLIHQEQERLYPGSQERFIERIEILTRHIRPVSLACLRQGENAEAWLLYSKTFRWNLSLGRIRYLLGFLVLAGLAYLKSSRRLVN